MSFAEIEDQLDNLSPDELRRLALHSRNAFIRKEEVEDINFSDEDDPDLLAALDEAVNKADVAANRGRSGPEVRSLIREWTSK